MQPRAERRTPVDLIESLLTHVPEALVNELLLGGTVENAFPRSESSSSSGAFVEMGC